MSWTVEQRTRFQALHAQLKCASCKFADKDAIAKGEPCCTAVRGFEPDDADGCKTREEEV